MRRRLKRGPTANLQRLQQYNRQQSLPASHTGLARGASGASLYPFHAAMFTIAPTMLCQLQGNARGIKDTIRRKDNSKGCKVWDEETEIKFTAWKCLLLSKSQETVCLK